MRPVVWRMAESLANPDGTMATYDLDWADRAPDECRGGAVAIGNFDGVHRGHAALLAELRAAAQRAGGPAVAVTFDPHPLALLRPDRLLPALSTLPDRAAWLQQVGADHVVVLRTTPSLLALEPADFFAKVLQEGLGARAIAEGGNFCFGRNRAGNIETLGKLCSAAGVGLAIVPPLLLDGVRVSSSRVRTAVLAGDVREAERLLGRPYRLHGVVEPGQHRGQSIGFPTANLGQLATLCPGGGVYAVRVPVGAAVWPGAANVGPNPTFGEQARKVEVHLIGFHGDLYGQPLAVDFIQRLRDTRSFPGVAELVAQLRQDVEQSYQLSAISYQPNRSGQSESRE
jgi:riboflavin kinase/FMN adenylyltransferase